MESWGYTHKTHFKASLHPLPLTESSEQNHNRKLLRKKKNPTVQDVPFSVFYLNKYAVWAD